MNSLKPSGRAATTGEQVLAGIDTHTMTHHVAVLDATGAGLGDREFPATPAGHAAITGFITAFGAVSRIGVEGTGSYGAGLARALRADGFTVAEVIRPKRAQRRRGKSDPLDAYAAAEQALADPDLPIPKDGDGVVEQIRAMLTVRRSAIKARSASIRQIRALLLTAPEPMRSRWAPIERQTQQGQTQQGQTQRSATELIKALAETRPAAATSSVTAARGTALRSLARRYQCLSEEIASIDTELEALVEMACPALAAAFGIGPTTAAQLLVTAGDTPARLRSEAAFAALCGTAPIPASSGETTRHRLNRGGDRKANAALHTIALVRMSCDPRTRVYTARRISEGKTRKEILRCLKRAIAREVWHLLIHPALVPDTSDLRPLRVGKAVTLREAGRHFGHWPATISRLERGLLRDDELADLYRAWLTDQPDSRPSPDPHAHTGRPTSTLDVR